MSDTLKTDQDLSKRDDDGISFQDLSDGDAIDPQPLIEDDEEESAFATPPHSRRRAWLVVVSLVLLAALIGGGALFYIQRTQTSQVQYNSVAVSTGNLTTT